MSRLVCRDFEEFQVALQGVDGRYQLMSRPVGDWRLHTIDLDGMVLMCGRDATGNLYQASTLPGHFALFVSLETAGIIAVNGGILGPSTVAWLAPGREFRILGKGPSRWLAVAVASELLWRTCAEDEDRPLLNALALTHVGAASAQSIAQLVATSRRLLRADASAHALASCRAREAAGMQLLRCTLAVLRSMDISTEHPKGRPPIARDVVIDRAIQLVESNLGQGIHVEDLCRACGVSIRTLQSIFLEQLGMSPYRYLANRRLHAVHAALRDAGPGETISALCGRFGIWDFGRFAQAYRTMFGQLPSALLAARQQKRITS